MVHQLGGPCREVECYQNGGLIFIAWPMNGLIRIVNKTGALWDNRKGPWYMHPDDLKRVVLGFLPYNIDDTPSNPGITRCAAVKPKKRYTR